MALGLFTGTGMYALDFSYKYGKRRHLKSTEEHMGDARSISGQMSREASMYSKLELALMMLKRALAAHGITAGYVLFDRWYSWSVFISANREINKDLHVICRLKDAKVQYGYNGKQYRLSELYQKVKPLFRKDTMTGLWIARATVTLPETGEEVAIIFSKDYCEPQDSDIKGVCKDKSPKGVAFLSTDTHLHASTIIRKYTNTGWNRHITLSMFVYALLNMLKGSAGEAVKKPADLEGKPCPLQSTAWAPVSLTVRRSSSAPLGSLFEHEKNCGTDFYLVPFQENSSGHRQVLPLQKTTCYGCSIWRSTTVVLGKSSLPDYAEGLNFLGQL